MGFKAVSDWLRAWQEGCRRGGAYDKIGEAQKIESMLRYKNKKISDPK